MHAPNGAQKLSDWGWGEIRCSEESSADIKKLFSSSAENKHRALPAPGGDAQRWTDVEGLAGYQASLGFRINVVSKWFAEANDDEMLKITVCQLNHRLRQQKLWLKFCLPCDAKVKSPEMTTPPAKHTQQAFRSKQPAWKFIFDTFLRVSISPHGAFVLRVHLASFGTVPSIGELWQVTGSADDPKTIQRVVVSLDLVLLSWRSFDAAGATRIEIYSKHKKGLWNILRQVWTWFRFFEIFKRLFKIRTCESWPESFRK